MLRTATSVLVSVCLAALALACGGGSKSTPSAPTPPAPTIVSLNGNVTVTGGTRIADVKVTILDGPNQGRTATTNTNGDYTFDGLTPGNANLSAKKMPVYGEVAKGLYIDGVSRMDFVFATPTCETNNTAWISFEDRSPNTSYAIVWDGVRVATLNPGQHTDRFVEAAGVQHVLTFKNANTGRLACATSYPVLAKCSDMVYWCTYDALHTEVRH